MDVLPLMMLHITTSVLVLKCYCRLKDWNRVDVWRWLLWKFVAWSRYSRIRSSTVQWRWTAVTNCRLTKRRLQSRGLYSCHLPLLPYHWPRQLQ